MNAKTKSYVLAALVGGLVLSFNASWGAVTSDVIVRQLAPTRSEVVVDFALSDVTAPTEIAVTLNQGSHALGDVPAAAFTRSRAFLRGGTYRVAFDPARVPALAGLVRLDDLSVTLTPSALAGDEILYAIFDIEKATPPQLVTREALVNGVWGAWEETIWPNVTAVKTPVWTGVTNDTKYALTHLVMRRIDAGTFNFGYAESADVGKQSGRTSDHNEPQNFSQRAVTITKPYYIGVYEFTAKQLRLLTGNTRTDNLNKPTLSDSFDKIRGAYTTAGGAYDWPTDKTVGPDSFIGKLRARTGVNFDLPTEAQWEKAARAGSSGVYYDGCEQTRKNERNAIAWNNSNTDKDDGTITIDDIRPVGLLKPNNYGLYDTLGNAWEWVLDWQAGSGIDLASTDPLGATAAGPTFWSKTGKPKRVLRGANAGSYWWLVTLHQRTQNPVDESSIRYGWRVALPASEIDGPVSSATVSESGVAVNARPNDTFHWATYAASRSALELDWPGNAKSAKLTIVRSSGTNAVIVAAGTQSVQLGCAIPQETRREDVLSLTLAYYDGADASGYLVTTKTFIGLGLIAPTASVAVSDTARATMTGRYHALPIAQGTTSLAIGGVEQPIGTGCCWFGWKGFSFNAPYSFTQTLDTGDTLETNVTAQPAGMGLIIR